MGEIPEDMEQMKFKEVEKRFLKQFNMPPEEKLVNCEELSTTHMHPCPSLLQYPFSCSMYHLSVSSLGSPSLNSNEEVMYRMLPQTLSSTLVQ